MEPRIEFKYVVRYLNNINLDSALLTLSTKTGQSLLSETWSVELQALLYPPTDKSFFFIYFFFFKKTHYVHVVPLGYGTPAPIGLDSRERAVNRLSHA